MLVNVCFFFGAQSFTEANVMELQDLLLTCFSIRNIKIINTNRRSTAGSRSNKGGPFEVLFILY